MVKEADILPAVEAENEVKEVARGEEEEEEEEVLLMVETRPHQMSSPLS